MKYRYKVEYGDLKRSDGVVKEIYVKSLKMWCKYTQAILNDEVLSKNYKEKAFYLTLEEAIELARKEKLDHVLEALEDEV